MKIFPTSGIRQLDAYTIEHEPIASIDLMERAARALADAIGNNGGDALAVARLMAGQGYRLEVFLFNPQGKLSEDCAENRERLLATEGVTFHEISTQFAPPTLTADHVVVDGLFGGGRPLRQRAEQTVGRRVCRRGEVYQRLARPCGSH